MSTNWHRVEAAESTVRCVFSEFAAVDFQTNKDYIAEVVIDALVKAGFLEVEEELRK